MAQVICPKCNQSVPFADSLIGHRACPYCAEQIHFVPLDALAAATRGDDQTDAVLREELTSDTPPSPEAGNTPTPVGPRYLDFPPDLVPSLRRLIISPWRRRLRLAGIGLSILLGTAILAWLFGGGSAWETISLWTALFLALVTAGFIAARFNPPTETKFDPLGVLALLYIWSVLGLWYCVGSIQIQGIVHIENASTQDLQLELDGQPWRSSSKGEFQAASVRHGRYRITVRPRGGGKVLDELDVHVEARGVYILNLLKAETYYRGTVQYGGMRILEQTQQSREVKDGWIDATGVDCLFQNPPRSITVKVTKETESIWDLMREKRTFLTRGAPPPENP
jgi:hypothetical protein